jgi:hypothetical protein
MAIDMICSFPVKMPYVHVCGLRAPYIFDGKSLCLSHLRQVYRETGILKE